MENLKRFKILFVLMLALGTMGTSIWYMTHATPSPTVGGGNEPGAIGPCTWFISLDGTTPIARAMVGGLSVSPGFNVVGTLGQDAAAFLNSITAANRAFCFSNQSFTFASSWGLASGDSVLGSPSTKFIASPSWVCAAFHCGMIELGSATFQGVISNVKISSLSFDMTTNNDDKIFATNQGGYSCACVVQHILIEKLYLDLGNVHHGVFFETLGQSATVPSFDITVRDIDGHNGLGTVNLYGNPVAATSRYYQITVDTIYNLIDINIGTGLGYPADDRVVYTCDFTTGTSSPAESYQFTIRNVFVNVTSGVTNALVNGVKVHAAQYCYLHDFTVENVYYQANPNNAIIGDCVIELMETGSYIENEIFRNFFCNNTNTVRIMMHPRGFTSFVLIDGFSLTSIKSPFAGIEVYDTGTPSGGENVVIKNGSLRNGAGLLSQTLPVAIMLMGGANQGASGGTTIDSISVMNWQLAFSDNINEAGNFYVTGWKNITISNIDFVTSSSFNMTGSYRIQSCFGYCPAAGKIAQPFFGTFVGTKGLNAGTTAIDRIVEYTVTGAALAIYVSGGASVSVLTKDRNGNVILNNVTYYSNNAPYLMIDYLPVDCKVHFFFAVSGDPTVVVIGLAGG